MRMAPRKLLSTSQTLERLVIFFTRLDQDCVDKHVDKLVSNIWVGDRRMRKKRRIKIDKITDKEMLFCRTTPLWPLCRSVQAKMSTASCFQGRGL